ncbi:unnamed protein product [Zymoseptoria tritici ST99CH_1E4]|uniref:Uncharacterized protein n=1 Tax=Zymoseptoria tritici ST99CH_1E4 TaxID=1276532 RepID=A0A2H1FX15_ZYMTR|nr:unnamed protein product [Zymoseptoria tritici ST99CH_1E4]
MHSNNTLCLLESYWYNISKFSCRRCVVRYALHVRNNPRSHEGIIKDNYIINVTTVHSISIRCEDHSIGLFVCEQYSDSSLFQRWCSAKSNLYNGLKVCLLECRSNSTAHLDFHVYIVHGSVVRDLHGSNFHNPSHLHNDISTGP